MSKQSADAYLEKLEKDAGFKKKVADAKNDKARWDLIKKAGFDFTKDELKVVIQKKTGKKLTEEELENVSGGAVLAVIFVNPPSWGHVVATYVASNKVGTRQSP